jgi:hypothetical protein
MSTQKLSNVKLADIREFLKKCECKCIGINGGHEKWTRADLLRPIIIQTHIDPVPEFIVLQILRALSISKKDFFRILFDC